MPYFCSCRICKLVNGNGRWLSTKKTFKKHQKKERISIDKINGPKTESRSESESEKGSNSESISSCNVSEKRKFEDDELDKSDTSSESSKSSLSYVPVILKNISKRYLINCLITKSKSYFLLIVSVTIAIVIIL
jgi:hypothetical protein